MKPVHLNRPGSSLLLAILIVAITLGTASTLASLVIKALKRTSTSGDAAGLLYVAESGLERQLYLSRKQKNVPSGTDQPCGLPGWTGASTCTWLSKVAGVQQFSNSSATLPPAPKRDQAVQLLLLGDTYNELRTDCTDANSGNGIAAWAEVTRLKVSTDGSTWQVAEEGEANYKQYGPCGGGTPDLNTGLTAGSRYVVRIKALYDDFSYLQATAFNSAGASVAIGGMQTLKVTAKGGLAQQVVKATFPAAPAAVGFTDYVLFSECTIRKGGAVACP